MLMVLGAISALGTGVGTTVVSESVGVTSISFGPSSVKGVGVSDGVGVAVGVGVDVEVLVGVGVGSGVGVSVEVGVEVDVGDDVGISVVLGGGDACGVGVMPAVIVQAIKVTDDKIAKMADVLLL